MKNIVIVFFILFLVESSKAQDGAMVLSDKIARKMKDSLSLSDSQKNQLYTINMQLVERKKALWVQYASRDSIAYYLQKIEGTRDSLYHTVLSDDKYLLYKQKKSRLVNNN